MPYSKVENHEECEGQWGAVVKDDDGEVMGCHDTEDAADEQLAALNAAEGKSRAMKAGRALSKANAALISRAVIPLLELLESVGIDVPGWGRDVTQAGESMAVAGVKDFERQSFDEKQRRVRDARYAIHRASQDPLAQSDDYIWVKEVYEDRVIVEARNGLWEYPYTVDDDENVQFGEGVKVEVSYTPAKSLLNSSWLVAHGGTIKALGDGRVGGYLVRFSTDLDPDLENEFFNEKTDFVFDFPGQSSVYFHHGLDPTVKKRRLGVGKAALTLDEFGVWVETQLNLRDRYEKFIYGRCKEKKMGWSSGTAPNLVEVEPAGKAGWIKTWPLGLDATITPTPAEPRATVQTLKSYAAASKAVDFSSIENAEGPESEGESKLDELRNRLTELKKRRGI